MPQYASFGVQLQMGDGATPETFATIAHVRDIPPPGISRDTQDVTSHDSPGGWHEYVATILNTGEISFDIGWDPNDPTHNAQTGLQKAVLDGKVRNFKMVWPAPITKTWPFSGIVTAFNGTGAVSGVLTASVTIRPTGPMSIS